VRVIIFLYIYLFLGQARHYGEFPFYHQFLARSVVVRTGQVVLETLAGLLVGMRRKRENNALDLVFGSTSPFIFCYFWKMIDLQHHHNKYTTPSHIGVKSSPPHVMGYYALVLV